MDYQKHYDLLMEKAKNREKPKGYTEKHHVEPSHDGGSDSTENLVYLTAKEHFIAHLLRAKATKNQKDWWAVHCFVMNPQENIRYINSRFIAKAREYLSEHNWAKGIKHRTHMKENNPMFKEENKLKLSIKNSGENHPMWGTKHSVEHNQRISAAVKGKNNPRFDPTERIFQHKDGLIYIGNSFDFRMKFELSQSKISTLISRGRKTHKGWCYIGVAESVC